MSLLRLRQAIRLRGAAGFTGLLHAFRTADVDGSGKLSRQEFSYLLGDAPGCLKLIKRKVGDDQFTDEKITPSEVRSL